MNKKWLLSVSLAAVVAVTTACGNDNEEAKQQEEAAGNKTEQAETPEPDLENIPKVVAEVNGEEIGKEEFVSTYEGQYQQMAMQSQMTGESVDQDQLKKQTAESLIGQELLVQEANNAGYKASEDDINETMDELAAENGLESKEEFLSALEEQGMDKEEVNSQIEMQVKVDKLVAEKSGNIEATDEEIEKTYNQMVAQQEKMTQQNGQESEIPPLEEVKSDVEQQIISQKEIEETQKIVEDLREQADVKINL
ncbi:SurA N-terminal domain-containing protein [Sediminibacillus massiliensis]|uniref:SurA N-terminal domain-containing protein n=1 Tax=Sediminibacillus massiliensis TaxID=1926277 RepID=UPI0009885808|nr:SurA N-terminal domain-containing protein [Sediminibacillus massiliensis]